MLKSAAGRAGLLGRALLPLAAAGWRRLGKGGGEGGGEWLVFFLVVPTAVFRKGTKVGVQLGCFFPPLVLKCLFFHIFFK